MTDDQQPDRHDMPLEIEQLIDGLSDEFESAWKKGDCPRIEDYVPRVPSDYLPALLRQLVALEGELRTLARRHDQSEPQRRMMRRAGRIHGLLVASLTAPLIALLIALGVQQAVHRARQRNLTERLTQAVATVRNSRGPVVPLAIEGLREFPQDMVVDALGAKFWAPDNDDIQRLAIACALAEYDRVKRRFLLEAIPIASREEVDNLVTALSHDEKALQHDLKAAAADATDQKEWRRKTRLATVALHLGDPTIAAQMLRAFPSVDEDEWNPVQRTMFIEHFPEWSGSVEQLVSVVDGTSDTSLRSGMALAVGSIAAPPAELKEAWEPVLSQWHTSDPDSGVHSAAGWALRSWSLEAPDLPVGERDGFNWYVSESGLTMIRIPAREVERPEGQARAEAETIRVESAFWLSDCEVTAGLFLEFLDDDKVDLPPDVDEIKRYNGGAPSLPVVDVSWYHAVMFCNWLSLREGRRPCYRKAGKEQIPDYVAKRDYNIDGKVRECDVWELIPEANGFRLPTDDQWKYACRAGTTTVYSFGDDVGMLYRYAVFNRLNTGPSSVGRRLCNAWGLFDMHGNAFEWCQDWDRVGSFRVFRSGCWGSPALICRSAFCLGRQPFSHDSGQGFRVATIASGE